MIEYEVVEAGARAALAAWGREDGHEDLVQDLWVWYLERPGTQRYLESVEDDAAKRQVIARAGSQILAKQALASDQFWGRKLYSSEAVKDHLKGRSTNRYLRRVMPQALANLQKQTPQYAEALERRYTDGVVPLDKPDQDRLVEAHRAITEHVNILVIKADEENDAAVPASARQSKGGKSDPTAEAAIALIEKGDRAIELTDEEGFVTGATTYRTEMANVFDEWIMRPTLDSSVDGEQSVMDGGLERAEMYRAAVFPDLYPNEKPMLIEQWSADDRAMYCGGVYTPGYLRLVKG